MSACDCAALLRLVEDQREEIARLTALNHRVVCTYCGHTGTYTDESDFRGALVEHWLTCERHPARVLTLICAECPVPEGVEPPSVYDLPAAVRALREQAEHAGELALQGFEHVKAAEERAEQAEARVKTLADALEALREEIVCEGVSRNFGVSPWSVALDRAVDAADAALAAAGRTQEHNDCDVIPERDALKAENERLRVDMRKVVCTYCGHVAEVKRLRTALRGLLLSADAAWEERREGHDWPEACKAARAALEGR